MKLYQQLADNLTVLIRQGAVEDLPGGSAELRRQISRRYLRAGATVSPDEIEALGLKAIEIPTHPTHGIDLACLARILDKHPGRFSRRGANSLTACASITATSGRRRVSGPSRPWDLSCDHSGGGGVRLRLSFMG
jgi:hypothetical protein